AAAVDHVQDVADLAVDRQRGAFVAILAERRREGGELILLQGPAIRARRIGIKVAVRIHVLVVLLQQRVPAVVDPPQRGDPQALDIERVGVVALHGPVVRRGVTPQVLRCRAGKVADRGRDVVDVAATAVGEDYRAQTELVVDDRHVEYRVQGGVRVPASGDAVTGSDLAGSRLQARLVGDVTDGARLGAATEERALR